MKSVKFYELAVGARFIFRGKGYRKIGMSMADDAERVGTVFMGECDVVSDGPLLPAEEAAKWKPQRGIWTEMIDAMATSDPSDGRSQ